MTDVYLRHVAFRQPLVVDIQDDKKTTALQASLIKSPINPMISVRRNLA